MKIGTTQNVHHNLPYKIAHILGPHRFFIVFTIAHYNKIVFLKK